MSRSDVKELGELIDEGQACLLVIGESTVEAALEKADLKAEKQLDIDPKDIDAAVNDAAQELGVS
jgi:hypothetical protein